MRHFFILFCLVFSSAVWAEVGAEDVVCVRNYTTEQGSACNLGSGAYAWVRHATEEKKVCARIYAEFYCDVAPEFQRIQTLDNQQICAMDYAQPPVANYCESAPQFYDYVLREWDAG